MSPGGLEARQCGIILRNGIRHVKIFPELSLDITNKELSYSCSWRVVILYRIGQLSSVRMLLKPICCDRIQMRNDFGSVPISLSQR